MYGIVIQAEDNLMVEKIIECETLKEVQEELESLENTIDWSYIATGDMTSITVGNKMYHLSSIECSSILRVAQTSN
mgnify:CR=1 FL=1